MSIPLSRSRVREIILTERKTVAQLLSELGLSEEHVVLVNGQRQELDVLLDENDSVIVLPLIAGG